MWGFACNAHRAVLMWVHRADDMGASISSNSQLMLVENSEQNLGHICLKMNHLVLQGLDDSLRQVKMRASERSFTETHARGWLKSAHRQYRSLESHSKSQLQTVKQRMMCHFRNGRPPFDFLLGQMGCRPTSSHFFRSPPSDGSTACLLH